MSKELVVGVDEIWLKGANRGRYMANLRYNIQETMRQLHNAQFIIESEGPIFWISSAQEFSSDVVKALLCVPGVRNVELAQKVPGVECTREGDEPHQRLVRIAKSAIDMMANEVTATQTFKVDTRRSYKAYPGKSQEISRDVGAAILARYPNLAVDLHHPQTVIRIRILKRGVFVSSQQLQGVGGLPLGTSGHVLCLLSGGIDSPVASYLIAVRGSRQTFVFFHAYPFVGDEVKDKVLALAKILTKFQNVGRLVIVPFGQVQNRIAETALKSYRTLFFRRYMIRCANLLAPLLGAQALVMGDSLGQVSSQTLENIGALDKDSNLLILRPLIGLNKEEIIRIGERIDTFAISKLQHDDACQLFAPKHPVTRPDMEYWHHYDEQNDLSLDLERAVYESTVYTLSKDGGVRVKAAREFFAQLRAAE